jgi:mRNA interferase HicA
LHKTTYYIVKIVTVGLNRIFNVFENIFFYILKNAHRSKYFFTFTDTNQQAFNAFMKCSELLKMLKKDGWYTVSQKGSHMKLHHPHKKNMIIFPNHGSQELGKGTENKILKDAGLK